MSQGADDDFKRKLAQQFSGLMRAAHLYGTARSEKDRELSTQSLQEYAIEYSKLLREVFDSNYLPSLPLYKNRAELEVDIGEVVLQAEARLTWQSEWRER